MITRRGFVLVFVTMVLLGLPLGAFGTAENKVVGLVIDRGTGKGLPHVTVKLIRPGNETNGIDTDGTGTYTIVDAEEGEWTVRASRDGWARDPDTSVRVKVRGSTRAEPVKLTNLNGSRNYYRDLADEIAASVRNTPVEYRGRIWQAEWEFYRENRMPPSSKAMLAQELVRIEPQVKLAEPDLVPFLNTDPEAIKKAEIAFALAAEKPEVLPSKDYADSSKLSPELIGEVAFFVSQDPDLSLAKRSSFVSKLKTEWALTPTWRRFDSLSQEFMLRGIIANLQRDREGAL